MDKNGMEIVGKLRQSVMDRCRERIVEAANRARETGSITRTPEYGVTSVLKRRHGL